MKLNRPTGKREEPKILRNFDGRVVKCVAIEREKMVVMFTDGTVLGATIWVEDGKMSIAVDDVSLPNKKVQSAT